MSQGAVLRKKLGIADKQFKSAAKEALSAPRRRSWLDEVYSASLLALVCALLSLALYANTLHHEFTYDDVAAVPNNPFVLGDRPWRQLLVHDFWGTSTASSLSHKSYRPVTSAVYRLIWSLSGGSVAAFHAIQIVANAAAAALAVLWVLEPCCDSALTKIVAALLYTTHPIKTEAVDGIVGLAEVLSAIWCFYAFYLFTRKQSPFFAGLACFVASMCKETGVTAALIIAVYDYVSSPKPARGRAGQMWFRRIVVVGTAFALWVGIRMFAFGKAWTIEPSPQDNPLMNFTGLLWLVNAAVVQTKYLELLFWPVNLCCDYSFNSMPLVTTLFAKEVALAAAATASVALLAWSAWKKGGETMMAVSWYVAPMLPATHLFGVIGTLVAERLLYIPLLGWAWLLGLMSDRWLCRNQSAWRTAAVLVLLVACCGALSARTVSRNRDWQSNEVLFNRTLQVAPNSLKAIMNVAGLRFADRKGEDVIALSKRALIVDPKYCQAYQLWGRTELEILDNATAALQTLKKCHDCMVVKRHSSQLLAEVLEMIGKCHLQLKQYRASISFFRKSREAGYPDANCNMAVAMIQLNEYKEAMEPSELCVRAGLQQHRLLQPFSRVQAGLKVANHGILLQNLERWEESIPWFERAKELNPGAAAKSQQHIDVSKKEMAKKAPA